MHKLFVILLTVFTPALLSVPTGALPIPDSVNGDGVFSNTLTSNGILKILNRPNVDVHVDSDSSSANTAGSAVNHLKRLVGPVVDLVGLGRLEGSAKEVGVNIPHHHYR
ncbi:hypothetical protein BJ165DRAFT_1532115 [Panaeolus papilionaceus]|nr:hypothetical protein BJ165DRAFT_1532115 [Panaeolus papilionaceus]